MEVRRAGRNMSVASGESGGVGDGSGDAPRAGEFPSSAMATLPPPPTPPPPSLAGESGADRLFVEDVTRRANAVAAAAAADPANRRRVLDLLRRVALLFAQRVAAERSDASASWHRGEGPSCADDGSEVWADVRLFGSTALDANLADGDLDTYVGVPKPGTNRRWEHGASHQHKNNPHAHAVVQPHRRLTGCRAARVARWRDGVRTRSPLAVR